MTSSSERTMKQERTKALQNPSSDPLLLEDLGFRKVLRNGTTVWSSTVAFIKLRTVVFYIIYYRMFLGTTSSTRHKLLQRPRDLQDTSLSLVLKEPQSTLVTTRPSLCSMTTTRLLSSLQPRRRFIHGTVVTVINDLSAATRSSGSE